MRLFLRNATLHLVLALLIGLGLGLAYSWLIAPVTYVDANPAILRADFKDQYRNVIAASYAASHDLARARARINLLSDTDPVGELSAQAQRMLSAGEPFARVQSLAQLATDLQQGFVTILIPGTPFIAVINTPTLETPFNAQETLITPSEFIELTFAPTSSFEQTPFAPQSIFTPTPRPTYTLIPPQGAPFSLVAQEPVCDPNLLPGLLQITLLDERRRQVSGIEIIVTWAAGDDRFFTGFKPELGNGYADFVMQADTIYSVRVERGGSLVPNISAPTCTDPNGVNYIGGLLLTFQQT